MYHAGMLLRFRTCFTFFFAAAIMDECKTVHKALVGVECNLQRHDVINNHDTLRMVEVSCPQNFAKKTFADSSIPTFHGQYSAKHKLYKLLPFFLVLFQMLSQQES